MISDDEVRSVSRRLRDLIEPIAANVYFAPEALSGYKELGLSYIPGYFRSRSACMGDVPGEVVVAAFGVFNPAIVLPAIATARTVSVDDILAARQRGAIAGLTRILEGIPDGAARAAELLRRAGEGVSAEGHPIYAGLRSLGFPGDPIGDLWRSADLLREHRGDSHVVAWVSHGVDALEITLLTELWWHLPLNSYVGTRGWTPEEITAGIERLQERGLIEGNEFTAAGEELRASIEEATDRQERVVVEGLGDDAEELFALLEPWATAIVASGGYPSDPRNLTRK
ncbi:MAG: hypothetical protein JWP02_389 [Acidimicrobiales bacterium]|nr:hypothetical protein [Acidimicrobiales bacterium]